MTGGHLSFFSVALNNDWLNVCFGNFQTFHRCLLSYTRPDFILVWKIAAWKLHTRQRQGGEWASVSCVGRSTYISACGFLFRVYCDGCLFGVWLKCVLKASPWDFSFGRRLELGFDVVSFTVCGLGSMSRDVPVQSFILGDNMFSGQGISKARTSPWPNQNQQIVCPPIPQVNAEVSSC